MLVLTVALMQTEKILEFCFLQRSRNASELWQVKTDRSISKLVIINLSAVPLRSMWGEIIRFYFTVEILVLEKTHYL